MTSISCDPSPSQVHSITQRRKRATADARQQWTARNIMRARRLANSFGVARDTLTVLLLMSKGEPTLTRGVGEIADACGVSHGACRHQIRTLIEAGDISLITRGGGKHHKNTYHLDVLDRLPSGDGGDAQ